ncbi:TetR/AcrR family transcriptional regulator [Streptomyces sp. CWNU-52B]|uniref:TetR/AcrR family transcriptional regulator n=1 Tax=unclassified Streptomyces TaxID=2593676 RepID=UPI0039C36389
MDSDRVDRDPGVAGSDWDQVVAEHKERLRAAIGRAAVQIAGEYGLAGTTMSKIAERAGVSRATAYNYFKDVEHVLLSVVGEEVDRFYGHLQARLAQARNPRARLKVFLVAHLDYFAQPERRSAALQLQALGISPAIRSQMTAHTDRLRVLLSEILDSGRSAGVFDERVSPDRHAAFLMYMLAGVREQVLRGDVPVETLAADLSLLVESGLCQPDPSAPASGPV